MVHVPHIGYELGLSSFFNRVIPAQMMPINAQPLLNHYQPSRSRSGSTIWSKVVDQGSDAIRLSAMSDKHWAVMMAVATTVVIWMAHVASYFNYYWTFWFIVVAAAALSRYVLTR